MSAYSRRILGILKNIALISVQVFAVPILALYFLLSLLPVKWLYCLTGAMMRVGLLLYGRQIKHKPLKHMALAFPNCSDDEINSMINEYFRRMSWFAAEFIKDLSPFSNRPYKNTSITNPELLVDAARTHRVVVCYSSHSYNYENLTAILDKFDKCDFYMIYNDMPQALLFEWLVKWKRGRFNKNVRFVTSSSGMRIFRLAKQYNASSTQRTMVIGVLGDILPESGQHYVDFLNQLRSATVGMAKIGLRFNAEFLFISPYSCQRGRTNYTFRRLDNNADSTPMSITREFFSLLENQITNHPYDWMFWNE